MKTKISSRDLAYCGCFGAAALLLPVLFHLVRLGHVFMPMYLPLVLLAFYVRPLPVAITAFVTPLISGAVTGMPPFYPPVALFMAIELSIMSVIIAAISTRWPRLNALAILVPVLLLGRVLYVGLVYGFSQVIELPATFMAALSFLGGWPGLVLMIVAIPIILKSAPKSLQRTPRTALPSNSGGELTNQTLKEKYDEKDSCCG
ncbi:MAG: hypothetical protein JXX14_21860 [Deltaproteobacteria bacterium]|nr:hypothetical protein [Deltaproteobacteria bacterium]